MFGYSIIKTEEKKRLDNLKLFHGVRLNIDILRQAGPEFLREVIKNIQLLQNDILKRSTKIRDIHGLAYSDGASDFADKLKSELTQVLKRITISPDASSPVTGKKFKDLKKKK